MLTTKNRILVVDDEPDIVANLSHLLSGRGYEVNTAFNGEEALNSLKNKTPDLILLDLKMPGISGIDTLKEIRVIDPDVMVIIITGYGTLKSAIEAIRYGVFDYIPKPFNVPEIMAIIDKSIQRRNLNLKIKEVI